MVDILYSLNDITSLEPIGLFAAAAAAASAVNTLHTPDRRSREGCRNHS